MPRRQIGIKFDEHLLKQIDRARGTLPRTAWIEAAVLVQLADVSPRAQIEESIYDVGPIEPQRVSRSEAFAKATQR